MSDFLLQEDGSSYILQEDGSSKIILQEGSSASPSASLSPSASASPSPPPTVTCSAVTNGKGGSDTDATSYTTGSISVTAGNAYAIIVFGRYNTGTDPLCDSVTGAGITWVRETTQLLANSLAGLALFTGKAPSTTSGTLTL